LSKISLTPLEDWPALLMQWQTHPESSDIRTAFQALLQELINSQKPLYLLIDLRQNVSMPLSETINNALLGAYAHPNLLACLVIAGHGHARIMANIVIRISRQDKIFWFKDEVEAYQYLASQVAGNGK
jgi:hypothetical protein